MCSDIPLDTARLRRTPPRTPSYPPIYAKFWQTFAESANNSSPRGHFIKFQQSSAADSVRVFINVRVVDYFLRTVCRTLGCPRAFWRTKRCPWLTPTRRKNSSNRWKTEGDVLRCSEQVPSPGGHHFVWIGFCFHFNVHTIDGM